MFRRAFIALAAMMPLGVISRSNTTVEADKVPTISPSPVMLFEYEVSSPGSLQVDFGVVPSDFAIADRPYPMSFQKAHGTE